MFKTSMILAAAATGAAAVSPIGELQYQSLFSNWLKKHNKQYTADEVFAKFATFKANHKMIEAHNAAGIHSYTLGPNEFMDLTFDEFHKQYTGFAGAKSSFLRSQNAPDFSQEPAPASAVDWRKKGAVTPVKNQGQCGSCWAFSTTGSVEGAHFLAGNSLTSFSEQQLVDCAGSEGNNGCNGGLMDYGFEYVIKEGGLCKESDYQYKAEGGSCDSSSCTEVSNLISSYKDVPQGDEDALMTAVNKTPVSIAIEADQSAFQFYSGGVMDGRCGTQLDHGVLLVGYGTDDGKDYWIVKNSWGASWGEDGYIRLIRGQNQCGLANSASYPIV